MVVVAPAYWLTCCATRAWGTKVVPPEVLSSPGTNLEPPHLEASITHQLGFNPFNSGFEARFAPST